MLLPDPARDNRDGAAAAQAPTRRRRGLPAQPRGPLASSATDHPEFLRADRGYRHRDIGGIDPGQAGHDRAAAADLFHHNSRSRRGSPRSSGRARRNRDRRHRARRRLLEPRGAHPKEVHRRFLGRPQQSLEADLSDRRPRPLQRGRRDRVSRPHRHSGQDPRLPDRAHRNRIRTAGSAGDCASGGDDLRARAGPTRARGLLCA